MSIEYQLIDTNGKEKGTVELNPTIFGAQIKPDLMAQAVRVHAHNAWLGTRKTKSRGEVRGGGRKPWRQKGTGRARHGSIRSPIWVGGGHALPLVPSDHRLKISRKMRKQALYSALSSKVVGSNLKIVDKVSFKEYKTKEAQETLNNVAGDRKVLVVWPEKDDQVKRAFTNITNVDFTEARLLNTYDVLNHDVLMMPKDSLKVIEETFLEQSDK